MEWHKSESSVKPLEEDTTSSRTCNYQRRNIKEVEREYEDGSTYTMYEYDEIKIPKELWSMYKQIELTQNVVDYLLMEA